jgi:SAM-dependent methyltransferase
LPKKDCGVSENVLRPYYHRFAWAYDLLNAEPIATRIDFIVAALRRRGVRPPDMLLDAGCGTGRYAIDLAARGFTVTGVDQSPELVKIASQKPDARAADVRFSVADLLEFDPPDRFMAVLCRGVLNDLTRDNDREIIFSRFAQWLALGGVLVFDVRDWARTVLRYEANSESRREVRLEDGGSLAFTSRSSLDHAARRIDLRETFEHRHSGGGEVVANEFAMRCWSRSEISARLAKQFDNVKFQETYGARDRGWVDRLVVIATRASPA